MKSLWNDQEAQKFEKNPLELRSYSSRIIGQDEDLVLHGGGNTSVKVREKNFFGEEEEILYVKGSGWDLANMRPEGFAGVKLPLLKKMAQLEKLSDTDMVNEQRAAMNNPNAPSPSVEAILHAIIPFTYVDHTHADAVVTLTNVPDGEQIIQQVYGKKVLVVPYIMPGFILARKVYEMTMDLSPEDWEKLEGIILLKHGIFTFGRDAKSSYQKMIDLVAMAENYITQKEFTAKTITTPIHQESSIWNHEELIQLAQLRKVISQTAKRPMVIKTDTSAESQKLAQHPQLESIATRGPITPDHSIHTKRIPAIVDSGSAATIEKYAQEYKEYFNRNRALVEGNGQKTLTCLDPAPRFAIWKGKGLLSFGVNPTRAKVVHDIAKHTLKTIAWGESLGGWQPLPEAAIFEVEYWELEQAKLKKSAGNAGVGGGLNFEGRIVLVTGAASGIGLAVAQAFKSTGAAVVALDINPSVMEIFSDGSLKNACPTLGIKCDVTKSEELQAAIKKGVTHFGGLDILISNAGNFPPGQKIEAMDEKAWEKILQLNLTSHTLLLKEATPFLKAGIDPSVLIVGSKNVKAPGPGVSAYSVAKAGLTQLARVAAMELAPFGIRVNMVHPHGVFDTGIWNKDIIEGRAKNYGISVEEYKKNNLLGVQITSEDVAQVILATCSNGFSKVTGAQIPIDGGNDRVI